MANEKRYDLIDRNELLPNKVFYVCNENPMASLDELLNRIANAKTVDAVEVVHGRWEKRKAIVFDDEMVGYRCSNCNTTWDAETNYCPNCGAKMDGERKDNENP